MNWHLFIFCFGSSVINALYLLGFCYPGYHDDGCWLLSDRVRNCIFAGRRKGSNWCWGKYKNQVRMIESREEFPLICILQHSNHTYQFTCHNVKNYCNHPFLIPRFFFLKELHNRQECQDRKKCYHRKYRCE